MKADLHPQYFQTAVITCGCGSKASTGSTKENIRIEVCSKCHPFVTGEQKIIDTEGRVERLRRRFNLE